MVDSATALQHKKTLSSSIASFILGILSCVLFGIFTAIPAVILGHRSLSILKRESAQYSGRPLAIAGLISGYLGICLSLVIAVLIANAFRTYQVHDEDLIYTPPKIEDAKNAYVTLLPILKQIKEQSDKDQSTYADVESAISNKTGRDYKETAKILERYSRYISTFSDAMMLDTLQVPIMHDIQVKEPLSQSYVGALFLLQKLETLKIETLLAKKKYDEACKEIVKLFKYGYLLENSDGGMIYFRLGFAAKKNSFGLIQGLVKESNRESSFYRDLAAQLQLFADNSGAVKSLKREYTIERNSIRGFIEKSIEDSPELKEVFEEYAKHPWKLRFVFNESASMKKLSDFYRQEVKNIHGPYSDIKHKEIFEASWLDVVTGNFVGKMLLALVSPSWDRLINGKYELDARYNLTQVLLALKAHRVEKNKLPDALGDLVPEYLRAIPQDPFDGNNIRYSRTGEKIYSVYSDGHDDGGHAEKDLVLNFNFTAN